MIQLNNKDAEAIFAFGKDIIKVYYGLYLVWQAIHSCYGSGYWINNLPYVNTDPWKN